MEWVDNPPIIRNGSYDWWAISRALRANPNEWALLAEHERQSLVVTLRSGGIKAMKPEDGYQVTTRNNVRTDPRRCDIYIRWVDPGMPIGTGRHWAGLCPICQRVFNTPRGFKQHLLRKHLLSPGDVQTITENAYEED